MDAKAYETRPISFGLAGTQTDHTSSLNPLPTVVWRAEDCRGNMFRGAVVFGGLTEDRDLAAELYLEVLSCMPSRTAQPSLLRLAPPDPFYAGSFDELWAAGGARDLGHFEA